MRKQPIDYVDPRPTVVLGDGEQAYEGDFVRIGEGTGHLWKIRTFDGDGTVYLIDEVTGRQRKIGRGRLAFSFHGGE